MRKRLEFVFNAVGAFERSTVRKRLEFVFNAVGCFKSVRKDDTSANYIVHFVCGILLVCFDNHRKCQSVVLHIVPRVPWCCGEGWTLPTREL